MPEEILDDIDVEVYDDAPEADQGAAPVDEDRLEQRDKVTEANLAGKTINPETLRLEEHPVDVDPKVKARIDTLRFRSEHNRRERDKATRETVAALDYAKSLHAHNQQLAQRLSQLEGGWKQEAVGRRNSDIVQARHELTNAIEAQDASKQADAQEKLAILTQDRRSFEAFQPNDYSGFTPPPPQPEERVADAAAEWASKPGNKWFFDNQKMHDEAVAISNYLHQKGLLVDNDDHYAVLDGEMQKRYPSAYGIQPEPAAAALKRNGTVASAPRISGTQPRIIVRLSESERVVAKQLNLTDAQYAASKHRLAQMKG